MLPAPRRRRSPRSLVPGLALASAFVAGAFVAGLAGSGPLAPSGSDDARGDCEAVTHTIVEGSELVRQSDGRVVVVPIKKPLTTTVRRCP